MPTVVVMNLSTLAKLVYTCTPEQAVVAAYAQERNDYNTWNYDSRYGHLLMRGKHTVLCGNWSAFHCTCHRLDIDLANPDSGRQQP